MPPWIHPLPPPGPQGSKSRPILAPVVGAVPIVSPRTSVYNSLHEAPATFLEDINHVREVFKACRERIEGGARTHGRQEARVWIEIIDRRLALLKSDALKVEKLLAMVTPRRAYLRDVEPHEAQLKSLREHFRRFFWGALTNLVRGTRNSSISGENRKVQDILREVYTETNRLVDLWCAGVVPIAGR